MTQKNQVVLSLISHTNIGKTTLARTLLKRDIGEVKDQAHVTEDSERHILIETEKDQLILWDTPGFGNVTPLLKRLELESGAWRWILHEVVDRHFNRSLYSSVEAVRNVAQEADVVLYLVNVREQPEDAGYVELEMRLLETLGKPVLMILNQISGQDILNKQAILSYQKHWFDHFSKYSCLKKVLLLDAFNRTWHQELSLIENVMGMIDPGKQASLARLKDRFISLQDQRLNDIVKITSETLWFAINQAHLRKDKENDKELFKEMFGELQVRMDLYLSKLLEIQQIESEGRAKLEADIRQLSGLSLTNLEEKKSGLLAGAVASAGTGLAADLISGGLTFGGGALLGFMGGFIGGFSYARILNMFGRKGEIRWEAEALEQVLKLMFTYHLLAAIHGRGRGRLLLDEPVPYIEEVVGKLWPQFDLEPLFEKKTNEAEVPNAFKQQIFTMYQKGLKELYTSVSS